MTDSGIDFLRWFPLVMFVVLAVVLTMAFRFQSNYLKNLKRQSEALERIAASLEKRP
jgi:hypothetical protein